MLFGLMYLAMALQKAPWVRGPEGFPFGWLYGYLWKEINHPTFGWYTAFLQAVVLPNFPFFGAMSFVTEIALGLGLLLGLLTPLAGLAGALWQVNIMVGSYSIPGEWGWIWMLLIMPQVAFALCRAGRSLGLDAIVARRLAEKARDGARVPGWARFLA
jgi:hypothetical protein